MSVRPTNRTHKHLMSSASDAQLLRADRKIDQREKDLLRRDFGEADRPLQDKRIGELELLISGSAVARQRATLHRNAAQPPWFGRIFSQSWARAISLIVDCYDAAANCDHGRELRAPSTSSLSTPSAGRALAERWPSAGGWALATAVERAKAGVSVLFGSCVGARICDGVRRSRHHWRICLAPFVVRGLGAFGRRSWRMR